MVKTVLVVLKHLIFGGTEKYTLNLVNSLADKGINVILVTGGGPLKSYISSGIKVFYTPINRKVRIKEISEWKILDIARKYKPQIIHTQCRTAMICSQLPRKLLNIPLITHEHHMYDDVVDYPYIVGELDTNADKIATIGPYTSKKLVKYGIKKSKVVTILNGVDVSILPVSDEERLKNRQLLGFSGYEKIVACICRIVRGKGIDKLALGFSKVAKRIPDAKLIIVGDDEENFFLPILKEIVRKEGLQKKILIYPGEYDIRKYHAIADVFCYPALGKGMAVMEAMAAGLPVVGNKTIKKPLVMEDKLSGLMTESTAQFKIDPDQIAQKLIYLLKRPALAKKMGEAGRKRIEEKFNLDKSIKKTIEVYENVIEENSTLLHKMYRIPQKTLVRTIVSESTALGLREAESKKITRVSVRGRFI